MISLILCLLALALAYAAGRRSLVGGLGAVMFVGYFYGIARANVPETSSHFIFDAAVLGLYLTQLTRGVGGAERRRQEGLRLWVGLLVGWPLLLFFVPLQDYLVQLVGLRGNVFMLPFLLLGARLRAEQVRRLALWFAVLNLVAFSFACAEFALGVEKFFPPNEVTELIYKSAVDENFEDADRSTALRIPSTFGSAHAYSGTMLITFAYLFGAWTQRGGWSGRWQRQLLAAAMVASVLGVFMAAARSPVIILAMMLAFVLLSGRLRTPAWAMLAVLAVGVGWVVSGETRLQRFLTLKDTDYVSERVYWSVNENFLDLAVEYPMGNGLGGGGTSMPYFLADRVRAPLYYMENEYARIVLEQGVFGLCLWLAFVFWVFARGVGRRSGDWLLGRRLLWVACAAFFGTGMIGKGLLTSIPATALMLLSLGWIAVQRPEEEASRASAGDARTDQEMDEDEAEGGVPARQYG